MIEITTKVKRYDVYKDSGVEWLGEIPEHWETRRIKYIFNEINERSENGNEDLLSVSQYTGVTNKSDKVQEGGMLTNALTLEGYKKVTKGDLISNIMLAWNGSLGFSPFNGITSPAYSIYRIYGDNDNRYFHYLLRTELYKAEFKRNSSGVIESRLRLYTDDFFKIESILPPPPEQTKIAQFLDDKTTKIEDAITIKKQQINLLKERKQILIHKTVTQGLNPNVTLKDSGVEWIGEIPESWRIPKLKHVCQFILDGTHGSYTRVDNGYRLLSVRNIINNKFVFRDDDSMVTKKHFKEISSKFLIQNGDIQLAIVGATLGKVALVESLNEKIVTQRSLSTIRVNSKVSNTYLFYYLQSSLFQSFLWNNTGFSAQPGIYLGTIQNCHIPIPNKEEQKEISEYIETTSQKIETAISLKQQEIVRLKEFKGSLINEVVTGKVKVC